MTHAELPETEVLQTAAATGDPVLVRRRVRLSTTSSFAPGVHSHSGERREPRSLRPSLLRVLQVSLVILGLGGIGYYLYTLADQHIYQAYQNWAFDQQISGRSSAAFADYLRAKTPLGFLTGRASTLEPVGPPAPGAAAVGRPATGSLLGRVTIPRLSLAAIVRQGVDDATLSRAVGHIPSTALPGEPGNLAIAAHRDTLFRALKDIQKGDLVTFQSPGNTYTYQVEATKIVRPSDVSVLAPDGGGLIPQAKGSHAPEPLLTMITCYPFYYVGSAPKRFIVEARLVPGMQAINQGETTVSVPVPSAADGKRTGLHRKKRGIWRRMAHR